MSSSNTYRGYELQIGDRNPQESFIFDVMKDLNMLSVFRISDLGFPASVEAEVVGISQQDAMDASGVFEKNRSAVRADLQAIIGYIFDEFDIPLDRGVDVGCGMTGEMVEKLLPLNKANRGSWMQMDANPASVRENQRRHPNSVVRQGSYFNLIDTIENRVPVVTGLSSFDATCFLEKAVEGVREALEEGGFFVHIQDVRPGNGNCFQQLMSEGLEAPFKVLCATGSQNSNSMVAFQTPQGLVSGGELFRRRLNRAIRQDPEMDLVFSEWITARKRVLDGAKTAQLYFMNSSLRIDARLVNMDATSAIVTVAQKKLLA